MILFILSSLQIDLPNFGPTYLRQMANLRPQRNKEGQSQSLKQHNRIYQFWMLTQFQGYFSTSICSECYFDAIVSNNLHGQISM